MTPNNTLRQPSPSTGIAVMFITLGTLAAIWAGVWYYYLRTNPDIEPNNWKYFVCTGLFLSGVAVAAIGILVGRIGQEAQHADTPVGEIKAAAVQPTGAPGAAQVPVQPVAPAQGAAPVMPAGTAPAAAAPQVPVQAAPQATTRA